MEGIIRAFVDAVSKLICSRQTAPIIIHPPPYDDEGLKLPHGEIPNANRSGIRVGNGGDLVTI